MTGALLSPNSSVPEVNLETADVSGGSLNITVNKGDHFKNGNTNENALVAAFTVAEGLSVETRFAIPDYDNATLGNQPGVNFQSSGVVIGTDQNNLVKAVFGRAGTFEIAQDNINDNGNGGGNTLNALPVDAAEVSILLEVFLDNGVAKARAFYTFYAENGDVIGSEDNEFAAPLTLINNATGGTNLKELVETGATLGAGVVHTSGGNGAPDAFDVSYQYLTVKALGTPPIRVSLDGDPEIVESGDAGDTILAFTLTLIDADPDETLTIGYTVDGVAETADVTFDGFTGTLNVPVGNDDIANGSETVTVVLQSVTHADKSVILGAVTTATGTVTEDDAVTTVGVAIDAQSVNEDATVAIALPETAFADADTPFANLTFQATLVNGDPLPAWLTFDSDTATFTSTNPVNADVGTIAVRVTASDGANPPVTSDFNIMVANVNDDPTITPIDAGSVTEFGAPVVLNLLETAADVDVGDFENLAIANLVVSGSGPDAVVFTPDLTGTVLTIDPAQFAERLNDGDTEVISITYDVIDGLGGSASNTATFVVTGRDPAQIVEFLGDVVVKEGGVDGADDGVTTVAFTLTLTAPDPAETRTVSYTLDGVAVVDQLVSFNDQGIATIEVEVANDGLANGAETVVLVLTAVSGDNTVLGTTLSATATVNEDDFAPVVDAGIAPQTATEDSISGFTVPLDAFTDEDTPNLVLTATLVDGTALPSWLTFDGTDFAFAPGNDDVGVIVVRVTASDGENTDAVADFEITVDNVNDAPVVVPIIADPVLETDVAVPFDLLAGVTDVDNVVADLSVTITTVKNAAGEDVAFSMNGSEITIDPAQFKDDLDQGEFETVTVTFEVTDGDASVTNTATMVVNGRPAPQEWYFDADGDGFGSTEFGASINQIDQPTGYVANNLDADDDDATIYPDAPEFNDGKDNNQNGQIDETNIVPVATTESLSMVRNTVVGISADDLLSNDTDADGDSLSIHSVTNAQNGSVSFENGQVTFTAEIGFSGAASFDYTVSDGFGGESTTTVNIDVTNPDIETQIKIDTPVLSYANQDRFADAGYEVSNDQDALTLTGNVWKKIAFSQDYDFTADTVLRFDLTLLSDGAEVIGIGFDNDDIFDNADQALFQLGGTQDFSDEASQVANGQIGPVGTTVTYEISLADIAGLDFSHLVFISDQDRKPYTSEVTFANITLVEVDQSAGGTLAPYIVGGGLVDKVLAEDAPFQIDLPFLDNDTDFTDLSFDFVGLPDFVTEQNGVLVGTAENDDVGTYQISVTATDPDGNAATDSFELTIENTNDAPTVTGTIDTQNAILNESFELPLAGDLFTDVDVGDVLAYRAEGLPVGMAIDPETGQISGTPLESGDFTITLFAGDLAGAETQVNFALDVADGPPREIVLIEGENFTGLTDVGSDLSNFASGFAAPASGGQVIRLDGGAQGRISTDLDSTGLIPGLYDITLRYMDELGGASSVTVLLDLGDGSTPSEIGSFALDRTDLPGQGVGILAENLTTVTLPGIDIPAGARLVLDASGDGTEVVRIDNVLFEPVENIAPVFDSTAAISVDENTTDAGFVVATDADGDTVTYAIDTASTDAAAFTIDADTGALSFVAAPDFEVPADADADGIYDITVTADDGRDVTEQVLTVTVANANDAPTPTPLVISRTVGLNQPIVLSALAALFADQDTADTLAITADGLPAGLSIVDGAFVGSPSEAGNFTITLTANDGTADPVITTFDLTVALDFGAVSPDEDLDGDEILNADDPDVDGDGIDNADDLFAYDSGNGMTLLAGQTQTYDFDIDGTIFENGMTGFLQGTANGGDFNEDTGAASVANGLMTVDPVTGGDTGTLNTPQDDAVVGVKNGTFTAKAVVLNPWVGDAPNPGGFDQIGLVLGLDSADMIKLVFGQTAGVVEFQKQDADVGTKFGGAGPTANVPFPAGVTLDNFAKAEITFDVVSTDAATATVTGTIVFQNDDGSVVGTMNLGAAPIGGALAAALDDADAGVAVGFTHADAAAAPGFVAQMDSLEISVADDGTGGGGDDVVVYRINGGGDQVAAIDGGPDWAADSIAAPSQFLTVSDNRGDTGAYAGDAGAIPVTLPAAVLNTARSSDGVFSYDLPTSILGGGENFEVRLYLAELFEGGQAGGFRNFDATLEGFATAAFNNIDPGTLFGADVGVLTAQVKVTDGVLNIGFAQDIVQNPIINAIEIVALSTDVENPDPPITPESALESFAAQTDLDTTATYTDEVGSAVLEVMTGNNNIQSSNFGASSFQVTNTGSKKIAAVFIDVSSALYQDSVFDSDGQGGDTAAKDWDIDSDGGTGAFVSGSGYFLPGVDPIPNSGGSGGDSNGGFKGAMVKFNVNDDGGFESGETVGFSGDMDPNSVAGMSKGAIDGSAILSWDVGGISGHEIIGSLFTVLFDDGTTASGQLASDGSSAGSHAIADQSAPASAAPGLAVNGNLPGQNGTYGGVLPTVTVTGEPGDKVQITLTKGFNPVTETDNGIVTIVEDRLARYDFNASNAFDVQTVVVTIGADGTFDASTLFDYDDAVNNNVGSGTFAGDDVAQIGFVATKVAGGQGSLPVSATTSPIYLTNEGGPVVGDPTGGIDGYFAINGSGGNNPFFKIQIEDANGTGGTNPGGKWSYETATDDAGRQAGFQGDGYYLFGSDTSTAIDSNVGGDELLEYTIFVPESDLGTYTFSFVASRDGLAAGDQQNDVWLNFKHAEDAGNGDIEEFLTGNGANEAEPTAGGFFKLFGGPNNGTWGNAGQIDGAPGNFGASIEITEEGLYTIQVDGRSQGFHIDYFEMFQGGNPGAGSANSTFVEGDPNTGGGGPVDGTLIVEIDSAADDWEERGGATSADLELGDNGGPQFVGLRFDDIDIPDGAVLSEAFIRFTALESNSAPASFTINIEDDETAAEYTTASDPGARDYTGDEFIWTADTWTAGNVYETGDLSTLINNLIGNDGVVDGAFGFFVDPINPGASRVAEAFGSGDAAELVLIFDQDNLL